MAKSLLLVDGSSYFFRAFHALPPLTNSKGQATGAIYGVVNMIKKLMAEVNPDYVGIVFDAKGKTFRDELYPLYKAHRPSMPAELSSQFPLLIDLLKAMGFPLLVIPGVEADDVIGTLAEQATALHMTTLISTGDKDLAQLVDAHVTLINTMSNQTLDNAKVYTKFGVHPNQMIDYLALVGDTSDNVPGIPNCGPKTAAKWLASYKTLDNLVAHADAITGKIGDHLRANLEQLALSKQLVTIKLDVKLPEKITDLTLKDADNPTLLSLLQALEFKSWVKEQAIPTSKNATVDIITTEKQCQALIKKLKACSLFCLDTETTALDAMEAEIVGISLAMDPKNPIYIPFLHQDGSPQLPRKNRISCFKTYS